MAKKDQANEPAAAPERPAAQRLVLTLDAALGNGTRKRGTVMAIDEGSGYQPADGVSPGEVKTLLNNPQLFEVTD